MMSKEQQNEFWTLYESRARKPIEQACTRTSRSLSDNTMDVLDMIAWVDDRVWRMLRLEQAPLFHDQPTPEVAVERIIASSRTLSRWAYLALSRRHWKRLERSQEFVAAASREERLAYVRAEEVPAENKEEIEAKLAKVRAAVSQNVRRRAAASWQELAERHRIAIALGATEKDDQELIDQTTGGEMKVNTVEQMRSRSIRRMREILLPAADAAKTIALVIVASVLILMSAEARAGEQSGGRGGGKGFEAAQQVDVHAKAGEQSGGRGGSKGGGKGG